MSRTLFPALAITIPIVAGLALLYLFIAGDIGTATMLAASFALAAFAVTAVTMHDDAGDEDAEGLRPPHLRL